MSAIIIWTFRILVLYVIIRILYSLFMKNKARPGDKQDKVRRFDADGKKVVDADFEEL